MAYKFIHRNTKGGAVRQSDGSAGETAARFWFMTRGWKMTRNQPEVRVLRHLGDGQFVVHFHKGGVADFTGQDEKGYFRACEVKEADGDRMAASVLDKDQRRYLQSLKPGQGWVGILWRTRNCFRIHAFKPSGSYLYEEGSP
jgi:hypothetical protein